MANAPNEHDPCRLPREIPFREYSTCEAPEIAPEDLFNARNKLHEAFEKGWLEWKSDGTDEPQVRASHYVGLFSFLCGDPGCEGSGEHLVLIKSKGDRERGFRGLMRFLDLALLQKPEMSDREYAIRSGEQRYVAILAGPYAEVLDELCRRDFRRYYRPEEGELAGPVRGRVHIAGHMRNELRGRAHLVPCRWEEFTADNWDNRILLGAARVLERAARDVDPEHGARLIGDMFRPAAPWFADVEEVPIHLWDFQKARLGRVSVDYRRALEWAKRVLRGVSNPDHGGTSPGLVVNAYEAFEKLTEVTAKSAVSQIGWEWEAKFQEPLRTPLLIAGSSGRPDVVLRANGRPKVIGDAKYKEVLKLAAGDPTFQWNDPNSSSTKISAADWNQLYVYLRLERATHGFFAVPYWVADDNEPPARWLGAFGFTVPPLDGDVEAHVKVLGLNLLKPIGKVRQEGARLLAEWLREPMPA